MSNVQQQRMVVEQLRREASLKRISVSQAVEDIKVRPLRKFSYQQFLKTNKNLHLTALGPENTKHKIENSVSN